MKRWNLTWALAGAMVAPVTAVAQSSQGARAASDASKQARETFAQEGAHGEVQRSVILGFEGLTLTGGVGIVGNVGTANDFLDPGLSYTVRAHLGSREHLGFELAYMGSVQNVEASGLDSSAVVVSNAVEGDAHFSFLPNDIITPYLLGGLSLKGYDLTNADFNTSSVLSSDTVLEIPLAAGATYRADSGFVVDGRFDYRVSLDDELLGPDRGLDNWNVTLKAGYEF